MIIEDGKDYKVSIKNNWKYFRSPKANYAFNMNDGFTFIWGESTDEDPTYFPAPTILDCEVTTKCTGINGNVCPCCYKGNLPTGHNMTFETFKRIFDTLPKSITQIAFGADSTLKSNPDLWKMMEYTRANNIIPNITAAQIDDETADNLAKYCGAVSISRYDNKDVCYDSIKRLTDRGMKQVNMHFMIADETYDKAIETLNDIKIDPRLEKLNAIVFLSLKKKGRAVINSYNCLPQEKFNNLVNIAKENNISIGFDTCSAKKAMEVLGDSFRNTVSFCESTLESCYISCDGEYFPCSFMEGTEGWEKGINVLECQSPEDFINKVWNNPRTVEFRKNLLSIRGCKSCPYYEI